MPQGTLASAQLQQPLSTLHNRPGDRFTAELLDPLVDARGNTVVPAGALVDGVVEQAGRSRLIWDSAELWLGVSSLRLPETEALPVALEIAEAPVEYASPWRWGLGGALAGVAAGAATGLAIDRSASSTVLGSSIVGLGVGVLFGVLLQPRDAAIASGSIMTLRVAEPLPSEAGMALQESARRNVARRPLPEGREQRTVQEEP